MSATLFASAACVVASYRETVAVCPPEAIAGRNSHLVVLQQLALE